MKGSGERERMASQSTWYACAAKVSSQQEAETLWQVPGARCWRLATGGQGHTR
jgi:hypothetical protein